MTRVCGIIAEYDPFHNGHAWQMEQARTQSKADYIVCIMSCSFTQRGMPALLSTHQRAEMALRCGADIVLGLPTSFSVCSAERFAQGGVDILRRTGIVNALSFGVEPGNEHFITDAAQMLETPTEAFTANLRHILSTGASFPSAQGQALAHALQVDPQVFSLPNTALAICYARANMRLNANLEFFPIQRRGGYHDAALPDNGSALPSATAVRAAALQGDWLSIACSVPAATLEILKNSFENKRYHHPEALTPHLRLALRMTKDFSHLPDLSEGIEDRLPLAASCADRDSMVYAIKSKRYTYTRINRLLTHVLFNTSASDLPALPPYAYVLGFRKGASHLLRSAANNGLTLYPSLPPMERSPSALLDARADDLWALGANLPFGNIYREKPIIIP